MRHILITGGAGFLGHHLVDHVLKNTNWDITILDRLTYASHGFDRLRDSGLFDDHRIRIFTSDLTQEFGAGLRAEIGQPDYIVHLAAETHIDNSIADPFPFIQSNVIGTFRILELARSMPQLSKMIYFSTDEVFGAAPVGVEYAEWDRYNSTNPYSASKAGGEELCLAWANTYKTPVLISHTMNAFGERQHAEKFIPMLIRKISAGERVIIHSDPSRLVSGSRFYIHCRNIAAAVLFLLDKGEVHDKYNIVGEKEVSNLGMAQRVADILHKPLSYEMVDYHTSRPGHDIRYALNGAKMRSMGWELPVNFDDSLARTIRWIADPRNSRWLRTRQEQLCQSA